MKSYDGAVINASDTAGTAGTRHGSRFAMKAKQWDNKCMTKLSIVVAAFLAMGLASADAALAQQSSTSASQQTPAATATAHPATAQSSTAAKTGQTPVAKP